MPNAPKAEDCAEYGLHTPSIEERRQLADAQERAARHFIIERLARQHHAVQDLVDEVQALRARVKELESAAAGKSKRG